MSAHPSVEWLARHAGIKQSVCLALDTESNMLIGVGGVDSPAAARRLVDAGASLVQLYTGLIYQGPALVRACVHEMEGSR